MAVITGYVKREEPRWPYYLALALLVLVSVLILVFLTPGKSGKKPTKKIIITTSTVMATTTATIRKEKAAESQGKKVSGLTVEKVVITSRIDGSNLPVDRLDKVALAKLGKVYCYTRIITEQVPQGIKHVWVGPDGEIAAEIPLTLSHIPADTWSYVNLVGHDPGEWEVRVEKDNGQIVAKTQFETY